MFDIEEVLCALNLEVYTEKFKENSIDTEEILLCLDEDDNALKELVPSVGHRLKLKKYINNIKTAKFDISVTFLDKFIKEAANNDLLQESTNISLKNADALTTTGSVRPGDKLLGSGDQCETNNVLQESTNICWENAVALTTTGSVIPQDKLLGSADQYKTNNNTLDGRAILKEGKTNGGHLHENFRRKLSQLLIYSYLEDNPTRKISTSEFYNLAVQISELFPRESPLVYYSAYVSATNKRAKKNASGKLYETYISRRRTLRLRGELPGTGRLSSNKSNSNTSTTVSSSTIDDADIEEKLLWLRNNVDPWQAVEQNWNDTVQSRLQPIINGQGNISDYFEDIPAIKQPEGYTLLMNDFSYLYPGKENNLFSSITLHKTEIIKYAETKLNTTRDKDIKTSLSEYLALADENNPESTTNIALIALAYLMNISPSRKVTETEKKNKVKGKLWKPSRSETRDSYITQAASVSDVASILESRRTKLLKVGRTLQPLVVFVGESIVKVKSAHVIVNNTYYNFKKLVTAVDVAFKTFQAVGACYPEESIDIWLAIQIGFYNIETKYDRRTQAVNTLLSDLHILK